MDGEAASRSPGAGDATHKKQQAASSRSYYYQRTKQARKHHPPVNNAPVIHNPPINSPDSSSPEDPEGNTPAVVTGDSKRTVGGRRWFFVCLAMFAIHMLHGLGTTIVPDIQGAVSEAFDNVTQLGWLSVGFTLGSTIAILPLGKAYGVFDAKWVFLVCFLNSVGGSALCCAARNMNYMIIGRVWSGVAGAGMYLG